MSRSAVRGRVVLYFPRFVAPSHPGGQALDYPPLSYLALGGPLRDAGFDVRIVDARLEPDAAERIRQETKDAVCLGISCLTGYSVTDGLAVAAAAKGARPDLPVVWGGWHPTFVAKQAVLDTRVDVVVRSQGERTFVEVVEALTERRSLAGIAGITYRSDAGAVETPDRPSQDLNLFPPPAYDLIDVDRYVVRVGSGRHFSTIFSRGCPYQCDFCLDSRQKWFGLALGRVQSELDLLVGRYGVTHLRLYDGNFFMGRERLTDFGRMIADGPLADKFLWVATAVANRVVQLDGNMWTLLRRAGCAQLAIGAETGSDELLRQITNKTTIEHTIEAVRVLTRHDINQYLFFMVGFPEEPADALRDTLSLATRIKAINPRAGLQLSFCIPLPGSNMYRIAVKKGLFAEPRTFEDWGTFDYNQPNLPHITADYERRVRRFLRYLQLAYPIAVQSAVDRAVRGPLRRVARWRLEHGEYRIPVEITLVDVARQTLGALRKPRVPGPAAVLTSTDRRS